MKKIFLLFVLFITVNAAPHSLAKEPITLIVPFASGGSADILARNIQKTLTTSLDRPVVVELKPGASGEIGAKHVAKSKSGNVILLASISLATNNIGPNELYNLDQELKPFFYLGHMPLVLVTNTKSNFNSVTSLQNHNQPIRYASSGIGTSSHIAGIQLAQGLKKDLTHIPYKGVGQAVPDLISGNVDISFMFSSMVVPYVQTNQIRPLAVTGKNRISQLPQVPTFEELGYTNFGFDTWFMLLSNNHADPDVIAKIKQILRKTFTDNTESESYRNIGLEYNAQNFDRSAVILKDEINKYKKFYKQHSQEFK